MTKSERERAGDLCYRKTISVKILLEVVHFQASFEGKEGRAVKRIPDLCGREAKGTTTVTISIEGGDT